MVKKLRYKSVEDVPVWKKAHTLTLQVYKVTRKFPRHEIYGLTSQLRRASSSVPANIVEGFSKNTTKELIQFLYNARASCAEVLYHMRLAFDLKYLSEKEYKIFKDGYNEVGKQINGWINSLRKKLNISH